MTARRSTLASIEAPNSGLPMPSSAVKSTKYMSSNNAAGPSMPPTLNHRSSRQSLAPARQSMAPSKDNNNNNNNAAMDIDSRATPGASTHRMSQSRQSMAPGASMNARNSVAPSSNAVAGPSSAATPNNSRRSFNGRQSLAPGAFTLPTSMALGGPSSKPAPNIDPRPLRSRDYINEMKARVHEFAELTGFSHAGYRGYSSLDSPTQALFLGLFRHVFTNAIDPNYVFSLDAKKPEEEVMTILQEYKYPAIGDVTKMLLGSASSQQYWPKTLGILDWMVSLSHSAHHVPPGPLSREEKQREHLAALTRAHAAAVTAVHTASRATTSQAEMEALQQRVEDASADLREAEHGDEASDADRAFFPFMWKCYERFWQGEDQFPDEISKLEDFFESKNASVKKEVERLEAEKRSLEAELNEMESVDSPLAKAQSDSETLRGDLKKFTKYRDDILVPKVNKTKVTISRLEESREEAQLELDKLRSQHATLSAQVSSQEMTSEEFDRLSSERATLTAEKDRLEAEIKEAENGRYEVELANSNLQQRLEERLKTFNPLGARVGLFPIKVRRSDGAPGDEYLDEIDLLLGQSGLLHPGLDLKVDLRNRIAELRRKVDVEQRRAIEEKVERQERYDEVCERLHALKEQEDEVKGRLDVAKEAIDEIQRLTDDETRGFNEDQLAKERKLHAVQQAGHKQLQAAEARLVELRAHQKHLVQLVQESLEGYKDELCAAVEECVGLKNRVGESVEEVAGRLGVEVVREGEAEAHEGGAEEEQE